MIISTIKNSIIVLTSFYTCYKLDVSEKITFKKLIVCILLSSALGLCACLTKSLFPGISFCFLAFSFCLSYTLINGNISRIGIFYSLISICINLLLYACLSVIASIIAMIIFPTNSFSKLQAFILITCFVYPLLLIVILKNKRLTNGFSSIISPKVIRYGITLCSFILIIFTFEQTSSLTEIYYRLFRVIIIIGSFSFLSIWWRSQITKTYREKLRLLELKTLRTAKAENEAYITKLEAENKRLGTIIHKDNRIVNAMADSVCDYLSASANSNTTDLQAKGQSLSDEINSIKTYRQELLCQGSQSGSSMPQTNQAGVDAIISFMVKEAASYGITMKFHFDGEFFNAKHFTATEMDFVHLLSDLLENAIIATRHANGKALELSLQILKGTPAISVSDSGIPFEIETFMKLGTCEASTHTDEGGTGIGLMDIWTFKKKYHASLVIEELDNSTYGKRLSILFDNHNKYLIISNRFQQIISNQTRSDLLVISSSTNELTELIDK